MRINVANGTIEFAGGSIAPAIDRQSFLAAPLGRGSEQLHAQGTFQTYRFQPEPGIAATIDFRDDRLLNVSIVFRLPGDPADGPTREQELMRKRHHDDWLRQTIGEPPYQYAWGRIASDFHHQHCGSDITVAYGA